MSPDIKTLHPASFPKLLLEIPDAPAILYQKGNLPDDKHKFLCVVGSRRYSAYGKEVCEKLIGGLSGYSIVIVSGLALGIDAIAHQAALNARLKTVAVLGSGLDDQALYPRTHKGLAKHIVEAGGVLLSEFEPSYRATPYSFPKRNRIMAGLSHAILVIEAAAKSGTLITARLATDYNRDVLTVPHPIFSKNSEGPHMLIRLGATPIAKSEHILEALGISEDVKKETSLENLTQEERKIMELLAEPCPRDELVQKLGVPVHKTNALLSVMELKGLVTERLGEVHRV